MIVKRVLAGSPGHHGEIVQMRQDMTTWVVRPSPWDAGEVPDEVFVLSAYWPGVPFLPVEVMLLTSWAGRIGDPFWEQLLRQIVGSAVRVYWSHV